MKAPQSSQRNHDGVGDARGGGVAVEWEFERAQPRRGCARQVDPAAGSGRPDGEMEATTTDVRGRQFGYAVMRQLAALNPSATTRNSCGSAPGLLNGDPMVVHASLLGGFARQMAVPSIARIVYRGGGGGMMGDSALRHDDTLTILGEIVRSGHSSEAGRAAIARMERIHSRFPITGEQKRYALATFIFAGGRAAERLGLPMSDAERKARWQFWRSVAEQMPLGGLPSTAERFIQWTLDYEREHWRYTDDGRAVVDTMFDDWETRWFPPWARPLGRQILLALMGEDLRAVLNLSAPSRHLERLLPAAIRAYLLLTLVRPLRTDRSWVPSYAGMRRTTGRPIASFSVGELAMLQAAA
jgi:mpaB/rubber oxygenase-like protein